MQKAIFKKLSIIMAMALLMTSIFVGQKAEAASRRVKTIHIDENDAITMLKGGYYQLKTKTSPQKTTDYITYVSSDTSVLTVNRSTGKLKAVKSGEATITVIAKKSKSTKNDDKSNVKDTIKVKVVSQYATTTAKLKALSNLTGSGTIKISTKKALRIVTQEGNFSNKYLSINVPNGDVVNNARYKAIAIYGIKPSTYFENAIGNTINVYSKEARLVINKKAELNTLKLSSNNGSLVVNASGTIGNLIIDGSNNKATILAYNTIGNLVVNKTADVTIEGSVSSIPVVINAAGTKLTSSVPMELKVNAAAEIILKKGAEASNIVLTVAEGVTIKNETTADIVVVKADGTKVTVAAGTTSKLDGTTVTPTPTPIPSTGGGGGGGGGGYVPGPGPSPTPAPMSKIVKADAEGRFVLPTTLNKIKSIKVNIETNTGDKSYMVSETILDYVILLLKNTQIRIDFWKTIGEDGFTVKNKLDGKEIVIKGIKGELSKEVTFDGVTYDVTLLEDSNGITLKRQGGAYTYTLTKEDEKTLKIVCADKPSQIEKVEFEVVYTK